MKIRYSITRWDIFASSLRAIFHQKSALIGLSFPGVILAYLGFSGSQVDRPMHVHILAALFGFGVGVTCMFAFLTVVLGLLTVVRKHRGGLGEHVLEAADDGFHESTRYNSTVHTWESICRIKRSGGYAYVYFTEALAHVIPMRSGRVDGDAEEFLIEVQKRRRQAEPGATDNPDDAQRLREDH